MIYAQIDAASVLVGKVSEHLHLSNIDRNDILRHKIRGNFWRAVHYERIFLRHFITVHDIGAFIAFFEHAAQRIRASKRVSVRRTVRKDQKIVILAQQFKCFFNINLHFLPRSPHRAAVSQVR